MTITVYDPYREYGEQMSRNWRGIGQGLGQMLGSAIDRKRGAQQRGSEAFLKDADTYGWDKAMEKWGPDVARQAAVHIGLPFKSVPKPGEVTQLGAEGRAPEGAMIEAGIGRGVEVPGARYGRRGGKVPTVPRTTPIQVASQQQALAEAAISPEEREKAWRVEKRLEPGAYAPGSLEKEFEYLSRTGGLPKGVSNAVQWFAWKTTAGEKARGAMVPKDYATIDSRIVDDARARARVQTESEDRFGTRRIKDPQLYSRLEGQHYRSMTLQAIKREVLPEDWLDPYTLELALAEEALAQGRDPNVVRSMFEEKTNSAWPFPVAGEETPEVKPRGYDIPADIF